jgi:hypothetical protein
MEEAMPLRERLLSDATALSKRGFLDGKRLGELKGGPGYLNIGSDLSVLAQMIRDRWSEVAGKCAVQVGELDAAEGLYQRINAALGDRSQQANVANKATEDRVRAYTLVLEAYDEARRAIQYLRWHEGDAEKIAPSLYAGRRRGSSAGADGTNAGAKDGPTVVATPPAAPPAQGPAHDPHAGTAAGPAIPNTSGTAAGPGGSPFTN